MIIYINDKAVEVSQGETLIGLLAMCGIEGKGIAVAVNNKMVPRALWDSVVLEEESKVMVIRATCGG